MTSATRGGTKLQSFRATIGSDALASVVVFLVALPLCMGVAIASGVPPTAGIITGIVGGIVVGALAGSPLQVSGFDGFGLAVGAASRYGDAGCDRVVGWLHSVSGGGF